MERKQQHSIIFWAPKMGWGEDQGEEAVCHHLMWFLFPLGCLRTQGLYCHPGSFIYNCPGLLEDDLGISCLGECRVALGALVEGAGCRMWLRFPRCAFLMAWWDFRVQVPFINITMYSYSRKWKLTPWQALLVTRMLIREQGSGDKKKEE